MAERETEPAECRKILLEFWYFFAAGTGGFIRDATTSQRFAARFHSNVTKGDSVTLAWSVSPPPTTRHKSSLRKLENSGHSNPVRFRRRKIDTEWRDDGEEVCLSDVTCRDAREYRIVDARNYGVFPLTFRTWPPLSFLRPLPVTIRLINEQWSFDKRIVMQAEAVFDAIETFQNGSGNNRVLSARANMTD